MIKLHYDFWGPYNNPRINERNIELPIAFWFIENYNDNLIEIGEVTPFYRDHQHPVYDLSSELPERRRDVFDLTLADKNVLSISTVEHVGFGDYGNKPEPHLAIKAIKKIMKESRNYMITFPVGYNKELDIDVMEKLNMQYFIMFRDEANKWSMADHKNMAQYQYNNPYYAGNAICVITNITDRIEIEDK
jgi:hypothetical protein